MRLSLDDITFAPLLIFIDLWSHTLDLRIQQISLFSYPLIRTLITDIKYDFHSPELDNETYFAAIFVSLLFA